MSQVHFQIPTKSDLYYRYIDRYSCTQRLINTTCLQEIKILQLALREKKYCLYHLFSTANLSWGFGVPIITYNIQLLGVHIHYSQCIYYGSFQVYWLYSL